MVIKMSNIEMMKDQELEVISGGLSITLVTGVLSPNGTNEVLAPQEAIPGAITAFTQIVSPPPGDLANIDLVFGA